MVETGGTESRPAAERLAEKLQAFYDSLPADEKPLLQAILARAQDDDVSGFLQGGDRVRIRVADAPYPDSSPAGIVEILF